MNKRALVLLIILSSFLLSSCIHYSPPEGYSKKHHTYDEMVTYAQTLDPQATVTDGYTDVEEEYNEYRIWSATINGIECGVASESAVVSNDTFYPGEFPGRFYRFDTDYYYYVLCDALKEHPELGMPEDCVARRFSTNDILSSKTYVQSITEEELDAVWESYKEVSVVLAQEGATKSYWCVINFPDETFFNMMSTDEEEYEKLKERMSLKGYLVK